MPRLCPNCGTPTKQTGNARLKTYTCPQCLTTVQKTEETFELKRNVVPAKEQRKKAHRLLVLTAFGTIAAVAIAWIALQNFPSVKTKIVFSIFGCGFLALAYVSMKTGIAPYRWGPVERKEEPGFFHMLVIGEIVTGILMIFFGWIF